MTSQAEQAPPGEQCSAAAARRFLMVVGLLAGYSLIQVSSRLGPWSSWLAVTIHLVVMVCASRVWFLITRGGEGPPHRNGLLSACGVLGGTSLLVTALITGQAEHAVLVLLVMAASSGVITYIRQFWGLQLVG